MCVCMCVYNLGIHTHTNKRLKQVTQYVASTSPLLSWQQSALVVLRWEGGGERERHSERITHGG